MGRDEAAERLALVVVGLHVAVRHRAGRRDVVAVGGEHVRGRGHAREVERARRLQRRVRAVRAPRAEVHHRPPPSRLDDARALRGDQRLQVQLVEQVRLGELCFRQGRLDGQQRLAGEGGRALGHRVDVAAEAQPAEPVEEARGEASAALQRRERLVPEAQPFEVGERVVEAAGQQVAAIRGQRAGEQLERGAGGQPVLGVGLQHRQLVEVREQRTARLVEAAAERRVLRRAHARLTRSSRPPRGSPRARARRRRVRGSRR